MTYETFKLSVLHQCAGNVHFPDILASMEYAASRYVNESSEQMLSIAYNHYCINHGLEYRQIVVISLLPDEVCVQYKDTLPRYYPAAEKPAYVGVKTKQVGVIDRCVLSRLVYSEVVGLPDQISGVFYIVSKNVKAALPTRDDLVYPDYDRSISINGKIIVPGLLL